MDVVPDAGAMRILRAGWRVEAQRVALVPTMGCLHAGHAALIEAARKRCDRVVVSIFVNPVQFGPGEDFDRYPRTPEADLACCRAHGADAVFRPETAAMYHADASVYVDEDRLSRGLCGRSRPGHFRGVLTVVVKLFNIVEPDVAVFGQKDGQQAAVIARMVRDLDFPVALHVEPTVRESDGLALSSRNRYLSMAERRQAATLNRALEAARRRIEDGETRAAVILWGLRDALSTGAPDAELDYAEAVDAETLEPLDTLTGRVCVALAVRIGRTRLIDNVIVETG